MSNILAFIYVVGFVISSLLAYTVQRDASYPNDQGLSLQHTRRLNTVDWIVVALSAVFWPIVLVGAGIWRKRG